MRANTVNAGYSPYSTSVFVTPYGIPSAPTNLFARKYNSTYNGILVSFTANSTNGSGTTTNTQYLSSIAGSVWTDASINIMNGNNVAIVSLPYTSISQTITMRQSSQYGGYSVPSSALTINNTSMLDYSFGTLGVTTTNFTTGVTMNDMVFDNSKNIIVCGTRESNFFISRYYPTGSLDTTFGTNGIVITDMSGFTDVARCVAIDNSNNIIVAGSSQITSGGEDIPSLCRYKSNGSIDTTFGTNGKVTTVFVANTSCEINSIKIDFSGRIVVCGYTTNFGNSPSMLLARYTSSGALDVTFNTTGIRIITGWQTGISLHIYPDNRLLVAGTYGGSGRTMLVQRFFSSGVIDGTFNNIGYQSIDVDPVSSTNQNYTISMTVDSSGSIFVAGYTSQSGPTGTGVGFFSSTGSDSNFALAKLTPSGTLDTTFSGDGLYTENIGTIDYISDIYINRNNKIVVVGSVGIPSFSSTITNFIVAMYNINGTPYTAFSSTGYKRIEIPGFVSGSARSLLIDDNNDLLIGGAVFDSSLMENMALLKYTDIVITPDCPVLILFTKLPSSTSVSISFKCGSTNGTGSITRIEYSIDSGNSWVNFTGTYDDISGNGTITLPITYTDNTSIILREYTVIGGYSCQTIPTFLSTTINTGSTSTTGTTGSTATTGPTGPNTVVAPDLSANAGLNSAYITFLCGSTNGTGSITKVEYMIDSDIWRDFSGTYNDVSGNGTIALSYTGSSYSIKIRTFTATGGYSAASNTVLVTPYGVPSISTSLNATPGLNSSIISFVTGSTNNSGLITNVEYNITGTETDWITLPGSHLYDSYIYISNISIPLDYTGSSYPLKIRTYTVNGGYSAESTTVYVTPYDVPSAPTDLSVNAGLNTAIVSFTCGSTNGSGSITQVQYMIDNNTVWHNLSGTYNDISGSGIIALPHKGTFYSLKLRVYTVNGGFSASSASKSVTPYNNPSYPVSLSATAILNGAYITFTSGSTNNSGSITNVQYSIDNGNWSDLSGRYNDVSGNGTISILPYTGSSYSIKLREYTDNGGYSLDSSSVSVTPYGIPSPPMNLEPYNGFRGGLLKFDCGSTNGSGSITKIQYKINSGSWVDLSTETYNDISGSVIIPLTYTGSSYGITLREYTDNGGYSIESDTVSITPYDTPSKITDLSANVGLNSATISFTLGNTNRSGLVTEVQYFILGESQWKQAFATHDNVTGTTASISLPYTGSSYSISLRYRTLPNLYSEQSDWISVTPYGSPSPPTNVTATPSFNSAAFTFTLGNTNLSGSVTGIEYSTDNGDTWQSPLTTTLSDVSGSITIPLLYKGSDYFVVLRQSTTNGGFSDKSHPASTISSYTTPGAPSIDYTENRLNSALLQITNGNTNNSGPIIGYQFKILSPVSSDINNDWQNITDVSNLLLTIPLPYTGSSYTIVIREQTQNGGYSLESNSVSVTPYGVSLSPTDLSSVNGLNSVTISFSLGDTRGSGTVTNIQYSTNLNTNWQSVSSFTNNIVTIPLPYRNGTYLVYLRQYTVNGGYSVRSDPISVYPYDTPLNPTITSVTNNKDSVSLSFSAGDTRGSGSITNIQYALNNSTSWTDTNIVSDLSTITIALTYTLGGYAVRIREISENGGYSLDSSSVQVYPYTTSESPYGLEAEPLNNGAMVSFTLGNTNYSGNVTLLQYKTSGETTWNDISGIVSPVFIPLNYTGLSYSLQLRQYTVAGDYSEPSIATTVTPYATSSPTVITNIEPGNNSAVIDFTLGNENGSGTITKIQYSAELTQDQNWKDVSGTSSPFSISLPYVADSSYNVYLRQYNQNGGYSTPSDVSVITPYSTPLPPHTLIAIPQNNGASLSFTLGNTNNSGDVTEIQYKINNDEWVTPSPVTTSSPLLIPLSYSGTSYYLKLREKTVNGGYSLDSSSVMVTPYSTPQAPTITSCVPSKDSIIATISLGNTNGSGPVTLVQYKTWISGNVAEWVDITNSISSEMTITIPLQYEDNSYNVVFREYTENGSYSLESNTFVIRPYTTSLPPTISSVTAGKDSALLEYLLGNTNGSGTVSLVQYKAYIDVADEGSAEWIDLSAVNNTVSIPLEYTSSSYTIAMRQYTANGGYSSISTIDDVEPYTNPSSPEITSTSPGKEEAIISYTLGNTNKSGSVSLLEYNVNNSGWVQTSSLLSPLTISLPYTGSSYSITLRQYTSAGGYSLPSTSAEVTPYTNTLAPQITSTTTLNTTATITFDSSFNSIFGTIQKYSYVLRAFNNATNSWDSSQLVDVNTTAYNNTIQLTGLTIGTRYSIILNTVDLLTNGITIESVTTTSSTFAAYSNPDPPSITNIIERDTYVTVSYASSSLNGADSIVRYEYSIDNGSNYTQLSSTSTSGSFQVTGLQNGNSYKLLLRIIAKLNTEPIIYTTSSETESFTFTPFTSPSAAVISSILPGNQNMTIYLTPGNKNGSGNIQKYRVKYQTVADGISYMDIVANNGTTSIVAGPFVNGTSYNISLITITKRDGSSSESLSSVSNVISDIIPYTNPESPTIGVITASSNSATIQITAGNTNGSGDIIGYEYSLNGESTFTRISATPSTTSLTINNLTNGNSYTISVRSVTNRIGSLVVLTDFYSASTAPSSSFSPSAPPSSPEITSVTTELTTVTVHFTQGSLNGSGVIVAYRYKTNNSTDYIQVDVSSSPIVITGLSIGISTTIQLQVVTTTSISQWSSASSSFTLQNTVPVPTITNVISSDSSAKVYFTQPDLTGYDTIIAYKYSLNGSSTYTTVTTLGSPIDINGLTNGLSYTIAIKNVTQTDESSLSLPSSTFIPYGTPSAPVITSIESSSTTAKLYFTQGSLNGSGSILRYEYTINGNSTYYTAPVVDNYFNLTGLTNGMRYKLNIRAVTSLSASELVTTSSFVPFGIPDGPIINSVSRGINSIVVDLSSGNTNHSGDVVGYKYSLQPNSDWVYATSVTSPITILGLTAGQTYNNIRIVTVTEKTMDSTYLVDANYAVVYNISPLNLPPSPVITGLTTSDQTATISFSQDTSESPILYYLYSLDGLNYYRTDNSGNTIQINGIEYGITYIVYMKSVSAVGESVASNESPSFSLYSNPAPPTITSVSRTATSLIVHYTAGNMNGSGTVLKYQYSLDGLSYTDASYNSIYITIRSINQSNDYNVRIRVISSLNLTSEQSNIMSSYPSFALPAAPVFISKTPGYNSVSIDISNGNLNGSGTVLGYKYAINNEPYVWADSTSSPITIYNYVTSQWKDAVTVKIAVITSTMEDLEVSPTLYNYLTVPNVVPIYEQITINVQNIVSTSKSMSITLYHSTPTIPIKYYQYSLDNGNTYSIGSVDNGVLTINDLTNGTLYNKYNILVVSVNESDTLSTVGRLPLNSNESPYVVPADVPDKPVITNINPLPNGANVYFNPLVSNGSSITSLRYSLNNTYYDASGTTSPMFIPDLLPGVIYSVFISATNSMGTSLESNIVDFNLGVPSSPVITNVVDLPNSIAVYFDAPTTSDYPVIEYYYKLNNSSTLIKASGLTSPITINNLINGTIYTVRLIAKNINGISSDSVTSSPVLVSAPPGKIRNITIRPTYGNTTTSNAIITDFISPNTNGNPIINYYWRLNNETVDRPINQFTLPFTLEGLPYNQPYSISLLSENVKGKSLPSLSTSILSYKYTVPAKISSIVTNTSYNKLDIYFTKPQENGSPITSYKYSLNNTDYYTGSFSVFKNRISMSIDISNNVEYTLRVLSINESGQSLPSAPLTHAVTYVYAPPKRAPIIKNLSYNSQNVFIQHTSPIISNAPITHYLCIVNNTTEIILQSSNGVITLPNNIYNTLQNVAIKAGTSVGYSPLSDTRSFKVISP